ncbi:zinc-ribbon domain-containing protein [Maridesulfovibrio zosterae]|uniref:zinc-ribbon domain-containing protein n=1 Tax=Maridesulfovibrio zosterae TaxID=82171 RepID=UPI000400A556|nr:zinc-ribbon domain-containing protein [Maridesulfovibrio zosterae]
MKVTCPECNYSSEIPEDKIPANAQLATCPKCQIKFQFRELGPESALEPDMEFESSASPEETYEYQSSIDESSTDETEPYNEHGFAEENPNMDETLQAEYTSDQEEPEQPQSIHEEQIQEEKKDIWQRLHSMKPENSLSQEDDEIENNNISAQEVPFENLEKYGFFPGIFMTIKKIIISPASFFQGMELRGFIKPLIFFLLLAEFQEICNFIWTMSGIDSNIGSEVGNMVNNSVISESLKEGTSSALFSLLLYPLMLAGISFPLIGITHIMLMVFGAGDRGYQATFRATAYSYAPIILSVLPVVGDMIGAILSVAISIIAYKNIHNTTYMRVVLSMVMPVVLLLVILGFYMNFNQPTI